MNRSVSAIRPALHSPISGTIASLPAGLCLGALAAGSLLALFQPNAATFGGFLLGLAVLAGLAWTACKADRRVVLGLLLLYILALATWTWTTDSQQISDFGVYLRCGAPLWNKVDGFQQWAQQCQSAWLPGNPTYWRRSLLYTWPIGMLGGNEYLTLKLANALMHIAAVVGIYHVVSRGTSRQQGVLAAGALALFPEYWFTTTLATSDNLVVPLLVLWLGLLAFNDFDELAAWRLVAAAVVGVSLDLLRDIGLICVLTTILLAMLSTSRNRWRLLICAGLTFGLMVLVGRLGAQLMPLASDNAGLLARLTGHGITHSAPWADNYRWNQYVFPLLDPQTRNRYFAGLLTMDLQHGVGAAFQNWAAKLQVLLQGDGYYYFSAAPLDANPDNFPIGHVSAASPPSAPIGFLLKGIAAAIAILAFLGGARSRHQGLGKASLAFGCAFVLLVIGFGEIQPRYAALLGPALCIMIGGLLAPSRISTTKIAMDVGKSVAICAIAISLALIGLIAVLGKQFGAAPSISGFRQEGPVTIDGVTCNVASATVSIEERFIRIHFPGAQAACYSFVATGPASNEPLSFQVVRDPILPRWKSVSAAPVIVKVRDEGTEDSIPTATADLRFSAAKSLHLAISDTSARLRFLVFVDGDMDSSMQGIVIGFAQTNSGKPVRLTDLKKH
ncbi:glycosyltransferase family 39 protein [Cupriavidus agavae]|uniref:Glycosyltransferase RgtA/B/C/D-like domain-containing protein n=1 Tax=Cupriavidus agavae TaxID=1001822 RepID=A0A4Q7S741_9BURK|nr:glycosyltransferase family 39 protein [Cupriavidus agavae]RZT41538.1 hypothetical protein EV147_0532 [Cupriavidus agavae]